MPPGANIHKVTFLGILSHVAGLSKKACTRPKIEPATTGFVLATGAAVAILAAINAEAAI